jgi:hypothetical protein
MDHLHLEKVEARVKALSLEDIVKAWWMVETVKRAAKRISELFEARAMEIMKETNVTSADLGDAKRLIITKEKKDRFETEAIYKALEFTEEQVAVLPKNPSWRKTAILANGKTSPCHYIEESDALKLQMIDERFLKQ